MTLETELKRALSRKEPPAGFAERVMARIPVERNGRRLPVWGRHWRAIAATLLLTGVLGGWAAHTVSERREGERAREELLLALRIASAKLQTAQNLVVK
jgi:hypothetical protein